MFLLMCGLSAGFKFYYDDTQKRIIVLQQNNAKLELVVVVNQETILSLQSDHKKANEEINRINIEFNAIRAQNRVLSNKLSNHDIGVLGAARPGLVERLVIRGSANAGRCFELLSNVPLTQKEKEAKDGKSFNNECPWLWPGPSTP